MASTTDLPVKATLNFGHHQRTCADGIRVETLSQAPELLTMVLTLMFAL
jgi:hypothetical protein